MRRFVIPSILVLVVVGASIALSSSGETSAPQGAAPEPANLSEVGEIKILGATSPIDEEVVGWARDRYREARLGLPAIRVSFHSQSAPCEGAEGGHMTEDGGSRVLICVTELGPSRELKLKRTLLHEFAHAWDDHFLSQSAREKFLALRGLEGWSFDVPYEERGSEHAAETITWGLMDEPLLFGSFDEATPWHLQYQGYVTLTGLEPPHGYVWSLFAASHDVYAHTPDQLEMVKQAWNQSEGAGRRSEWIEVRFHRTVQPCGGKTTSSKLIRSRLHIEACPGSDPDTLLKELTGSSRQTR